MDIDGWGVILIWVAFFWPILFVSGYLFVREEFINNRFVLWWAGVVLGYILYWGVIPLLRVVDEFLVMGILDILYNLNTWLEIIFIFSTPTIALLLVLKKLEKFDT